MTHRDITVTHDLNPSSDPADFIGQSNVLVTFAPDETVQYVNVSVAIDAVLEGNETFTANLTSTVSTVMIGSNNTATATIIDTDSKFIDIKFIYRRKWLEYTYTKSTLGSTV